MPIREKLNEMKQVSGLTAQQISDRSGVPLGTISRILTGHTDNPTFVTVRDIVKAMDGSLDDLAGIAREENSEALKAAQAEIERLRADAGKVDESKELLRKSIEDKSRWLNRVTIYACVVTFVLVALLLIALIIDYSDPNIGFFWLDHK